MYKYFQLPRHSCIIIYQTQYIMRMGDWWKQKHIAAQYIDKQERVWWMTFTIFALLQSSFQCPLRLWICMDFEVVVFPGKFKCEHFEKIFPGLREIFGLRRITSLSSVVVCFNVVQLILFW